MPFDKGEEGVVRVALVCVGRACGECIDGCLDSFIVGDVRVEECDIYCDKKVVLSTFVLS